MPRRNSKQSLPLDCNSNATHSLRKQDPSDPFGLKQRTSIQQPPRAHKKMAPVPRAMSTGLSVRKLEEKIARATNHVAEGRLIVEQQRKLISQGRAVPNAIQLLRVFQESLEIFEADLRGLMKERHKELTAVRRL